jgi:AcrR family transcriptional regulator
MARTRPPDRLQQLVEAATTVFGRLGYRRAQMADIAREMGVAPGTLYTYVESKEALFDLVLQSAFEEKPFEELPDLPLKTPPPGAILARLEGQFKRQTKMHVLEDALARETTEDARTELLDILDELYARIANRRRIFAMLERSAHDWPELTALYYHRGRRGLLEKLSAYLSRRIQSGDLRSVPDVPTAARFIVETCAWFARHRHGDADSAMITDEAAHETTLYLLAAAFLKD